MTLIVSKIKQSSTPWEVKARYKVNNVVTHIGRTWQNVTGINTEPGFNSINWVLVSENTPQNVIDFGTLLIFRSQNNDNETSGEPLPGDTVMGVMANGSFLNRGTYVTGNFFEEDSYDDAADIFDPSDNAND